MTERAPWMAEGRSRVATFVTGPEAPAIVAFLKDVFGAEERTAPLYRSNGSLWNAELNIGDSTIMIGEAPADMARPCFAYIQVPDAQAVFDRALAAGAEVVMPPERRFYGAVDGGVKDKAGNLWWISTHVEDLTDDEVEAAARKEERNREGST